MNVVRCAFFHLLSAGLWNENRLDLSLFPLDAQQWALLYEKAIAHTVEGLLYAGMAYLPDELWPPKAVAMRWAIRVDQIERRSQWMNQQVDAQTQLFHRFGIRPYLLKGQAFAHFYANPLIRLSGDVDWYMESKEDYERAIAEVSALGVSVERTAGHSCSFIWEKCEVELHQRMLDVHNPFAQRFLRQLIQEQSGAAEEDLRWRVPSPLLNHLIVHSHILKHQLSFGIGLRQFCDAARVNEAYKDLLTSDEMEALYRKLGLSRWLRLVNGILVHFLGAQHIVAGEVSRREDCAWMLDEVWETGNFGFHDQRRDLQQEQADATRSQASQRIFSNLRRYLPYAPKEVLSFPIVHFFSKFTH